MQFKRALITGGAGLIGSHIADLLAGEDLEEIIVLDDFSRGRHENLAQASRQANVRIIDGDIRDRALLRELMRDVDVVFHQAAIRITQCAENPRYALEVLADGAFNVLEAAAAAGVKKVVAASSASVYGLAEEFPTPETHHGYANRTFYGAAKLFNEGLLRSFHEMYGLDYVALRYFNVYGPRMDTYGAYTEVLIRWMERLNSGKPCLILGDGSQTMDFVFVEDIARANILAAVRPVTDEVFNIASGTETSLNELASALGRAMGVACPSEYGQARKVNPVPRRLADTRKAERLLGFKAQVSLEEGLRRLVRWWAQEHSVELSAVGA
ncbi:MAG: NAD-dependent epimerase/dehydratase family protein [Bryobacteraceae bacterium]